MTHNVHLHASEHSVPMQGAGEFAIFTGTTPKVRRALGMLIATAFFLWHATALALFAIPLETQDPVARLLRDHALKPFQKYVLLTSQWQQWNLFSPDPLRRVSRYVIEMQTPLGTWESLQEITPTTYPWWRLSTHSKLWISMLEGDQPTYNKEVVHHFLRQRCSAHRLLPGTPIRINYHQYFVEIPESPLAATAPSPWPPEMIITPDPSMLCP